MPLISVLTIYVRVAPFIKRVKLAWDRDAYRIVHVLQEFAHMVNVGNVQTYKVVTSVIIKTAKLTLNVNLTYA